MSALAYFRRALPFLSIAVLIVLAYDAWVFYSRWDRVRQAERERADKEAAAARHTLDLLGGGDLKILNFYASPGVIRRGKEASICYSVVSAKKVRMEPEVEPLYPALSYCFKVSPRKDTEYKLFVEDGAGHTATASLAIKVVR